MRLKHIETEILHLWWFSRDYRIVIDKENWTNYPFKRKLYFYSVRSDLRWFTLSHKKEFQRQNKIIVYITCLAENTIIYQTNKIGNIACT